MKLTGHEWRCCGCGSAAKGRVKPCACPAGIGARDSAGGKREYIAFLSQQEARCLDLSELIKTRLLGVPPEDQDVVLEDVDWGDIVTALERFAR